MVTDLHDLGPGPTGLPNVRLVLGYGLEEAVRAVVVLGEGGCHPAPGAGPVPRQVHSAVSAARLLSLNTRGYTVSTMQRRKKRRHVLLVMLQFSQIIKFKVPIITLVLIWEQKNQIMDLPIVHN